MRDADVYEIVAAEFNGRLKHYNKGKREDRWVPSNPEDRDRHGHEAGFLQGLAWVLDTLFPDAAARAKTKHARSKP